MGIHKNRCLKLKCLLSGSNDCIAQGVSEDKFFIVRNNRTIGFFWKTGIAWFLFSGYGVTRFEQLSELLSYIGGIK